MRHLLFVALLGLLSVASRPGAALPYTAHDLAGQPITAVAMGWRGCLIVATHDGTLAALKNDGECLILATGLGQIRHLAVSPRGTVFMALKTDGNIVRLDKTGKMDIVAHGLGEIHGLAVDRDENIFVVQGPGGALTCLPRPNMAVDRD